MTFASTPKICWAIAVMLTADSCCGLRNSAIISADNNQAIVAESVAGIVVHAVAVGGNRPRFVAGIVCAAKSLGVLKPFVKVFLAD